MNSADVMKSYVPDEISQSRMFQIAYDIQGAELDRIKAAADDIAAQCFVSTATWGIKLWEQFVGITPDESKDISIRRSVVISKLRGIGTVTVKLMQNVAESFQNGEVDIVEKNELYSFEIMFSGTKGIPPNLDDLQAAIEAIKPAHLNVEYIFVYLTWNEYEQYNRTCDQWDALDLTWDQLEIYKG